MTLKINLKVRFLFLALGFSVAVQGWFIQLLWDVVRQHIRVGVCSRSELGDHGAKENKERSDVPQSSRTSLQFPILKGSATSSQNLSASQASNQ